MRAPCGRRKVRQGKEEKKKEPVAIRPWLPARGERETKTRGELGGVNRLWK